MRRSQNNLIYKSFSIGIISILFFLIVGLSAQAKTIKVGVYNSPPMVFLDHKKKWTGFCIEVLESIASNEGWELTYVPGSFSECRERLEKGSIDLQVYIAYSPERSHQYDFTNVTLISNWGQVYTRPGLELDSIFDIEGKKAVLIKDTIHQKAFEDYIKKLDIKCEILKVSSASRVFKAIEEGIADFGVVNRIFGRAEESKYKVQRTSIIFNPIDIRFAMPKGNVNNIGKTIDENLIKLKNGKYSG